MKSPRITYLVLAVSVVLGCLALPLARGAMTAKGPDAPAAAAAGKEKSAPAGTNSVKEPLPIPLSVFDVTVVPTKDPFYPNSQRRPVTKKDDKTPIGISASSFKLMAMLGTQDERLVMINHRSLAVGESVEVTTTPGTKATIRLLQIKDTSVIIRVVSPPQPDVIELSLAKGAQ
jgi:hypothetical protein